MKKVLGIAAFCLGIGISSFWSYQNGRKSVLINDFKIYATNLTMVGSDEFSEDLREFWKARLYYIGDRIPIDWIPKEHMDFGQSKTNILRHMSRGKESMMPQTEYERFRKRIGK